MIDDVQLRRYPEAYETLWHQAWMKGVEQAKQGLRATLIVKHPETQVLLVNFDKDIMQLIRETKVMLRLNVAVPESARMVGSRARVDTRSHAVNSYSVTQKLEIGEK